LACRLVLPASATLGIYTLSLHDALPILLVNHTARLLGGKILEEGASKVDVEKLKAPADGEYGHLSLQSPLECLELHLVAGVVHRLQLGVRALPIARGIDVLATGEDQPVRTLQQLGDGCLAVRGRDQQGSRTDSLHRLQIRRAQEDLGRAVLGA